MVISLLALASVSLGVALVGLLMLGARWRRSGLVASVMYGAGLGVCSYAVGDQVWRLPWAHLAVAVACVVASVVATARLRPDWNPAGHGFFGAMALTCVTFVSFSASFTFSGSVPVSALPVAVLLLLLEAFVLALLLVGTHEVLDVVTRVRWHRRTTGTDLGSDPPFVSIHVATHNEPPELVLETLSSLQSLDYPAYEVIVLDNYTDDEALWRPLEQYCRAHDLRFVHLADWPGFKAGALNHGLRISDPRAEVVALVDADFVVEPDFLKRTVGYFADPGVAIVQTAQEFRGAGTSRYLARLGLSYRAFDEITMPSRNERNAIIFAGTMGLIRREALVDAGGWGEWCVTEDAELSLRILARGHRSVYVERVFGRGVMPLTFAALKRQRFRWCFGGVQILRRNWRLLLTGRGVADDGRILRLTAGQRYDYLTSGLQWFQALATVVFSGLLLVGVASDIAGSGLWLRPLVGFFIAVPSLLLAVGLVKTVWGLRVRLRVGARTALAVFAIWLSLNWAVALACFQGITRREGAFLRTPKFSDRESVRQALRATRVETPAALVLTAGAVWSGVSGAGADAAFIAVMTAWAALLFWSAPVTAFVAARTELASAALEKRRRLEWLRGRTPLRSRPVGLALAGATAFLFVALAASTLSGGPEASSFGEGFALPQRAPAASEGAARDAALKPVIGATEAEWPRPTRLGMEGSLGTVGSDGTEAGPSESAAADAGDAVADAPSDSAEQAPVSDAPAAEAPVDQPVTQPDVAAPKPDSTPTPDSRPSPQPTSTPGPP